MDERDLDPDPLRQFEAWFAEAQEAGVEVPEAMALATATPDGRPSARMVLLKAADERGFAFHTNYESRKGDELAANPRAALLFHWRPLGRQVRVEGRSSASRRTSRTAYFRTRPLGSRIAAWASPQSRPLTGRAELERLYEEALRASPARTCRGRRTGAASASSRTPTSSGSTRRTGCTTASATSATARPGRDSGWRPSLEESARGVVRVGVVRLPEPLDEAAEDVADADHPEQVVALDDRQVPDLALAHQAGGVENGDAGVDGDRIPRHHVADPHGVEVGALAGEREDVALGEDADELAGVAHRDRADSFLQHPQDGDARGVGDLDGHHARPHHVADRHATTIVTVR